MDIFKFNSRIIINGASFSGKTRLCKDLLKKYIDKIDKIIIADSPNNHEIRDETILNKKVEVFDYIPSISEIGMNYTGHIVVVLDDNYTRSFNNEAVLSYFVHGRHKNISVFLLCQNLFFSRGKYARDISLNATHFILLKLRDLNQIQILANQIFGKGESSKILDVYKLIQKRYEWSHLLIDVSSTSTEDIQLRSNIAASNENNDFERCYKVSS